MYEVNRSLALIRPRAPFLHWIQHLPGSGEELQALTLEALRNDCNAVMVPPYDDPSELETFLAERYETLFCAELADWCMDESDWPAPLNLALFTEWFEVELHAVLTDLVDEPLEREAFQPFDLD
jgi:hypothetical protein